MIRANLTRGWLVDLAQMVFELTRMSSKKKIFLLLLFAVCIAQLVFLTQASA